MKKLGKDIIDFFNRQRFVIIATVDNNGFPHTSCKGILDVEEDKIYLLDLYTHNTYVNIKKNNLVSITAVDEEKFMGYCVKGKATIVDLSSDRSSLLKRWDERLLERVLRRILIHIKKDKSSLYHPEIRMSHPKYVIRVEPKEIISLSPPDGQMRE